MRALRLLRSTKRWPACGAAGSPALLRRLRSRWRCSCSARFLLVTCESRAARRRMEPPRPSSRSISATTRRRSSAGDRGALDAERPHRVGREYVSKSEALRGSKQTSPIWRASPIDARRQSVAGVARSSAASGRRRDGRVDALVAAGRGTAGRRRRALRPPVAERVFAARRRRSAARAARSRADGACRRADGGERRPARPSTPGATKSRSCSWSGRRWPLSAGRSSPRACCRAGWARWSRSGCCWASVSRPCARW